MVVIVMKLIRARGSCWRSSGRSSPDSRVEHSHWSDLARYCALIGWDHVAAPAILCHEDTAKRQEMLPVGCRGPPIITFFRF